MGLPDSTGKINTRKKTMYSQSDIFKIEKNFEFGFTKFKTGHQSRGCLKSALYSFSVCKDCQS